MNFNIETVAICHSCYKEKFAIPRQSGLVSQATATIELLKPYNSPDMVKGLEGFSHIWLLFMFHKHIDKGFNRLVAPPRFEGKKQFGLFSTRAPYRPNPIGQSVVELKKIEVTKETVVLHIKGADILDKTPIVDIKPYVDYADNIPNTRKGFTEKNSNDVFDISFTKIANQQIKEAEKELPNIALFIKQLLNQDPRPHYNKNIKNHFSSKIYHYDLHWTIHNSDILVTSLELI